MPEPGGIKPKAKQFLNTPPEYKKAMKAEKLNTMADVKALAEKPG